MDDTGASLNWDTQTLGVLVELRLRPGTEKWEGVRQVLSAYYRETLPGPDDRYRFLPVGRVFLFTALVSAWTAEISRIDRELADETQGVPAISVEFHATLPSGGEG